MISGLYVLEFNLIVSDFTGVLTILYLRTTVNSDVTLDTDYLVIYPRTHMLLGFVPIPIL